MDKAKTILLLIGLLNGCVCQDSNSANSSLPEERGLVVTTLETANSRLGIVRHIRAMPGYESFNISVPGITINSNGPTHVASLDIDFKNKEFYMYDYHLSSILVGTGFTKELRSEYIALSYLHFGVSKGTIQIKFDWLSQTLYWADALFRWIVAVPGQQWTSGYDYYKIIVDDHLDKPDGLAIDPLKGYLFWSDNGKHPKIERSDLQGRNRHTIVSKYLYSPVAMDADIYGQRIYWLDTVSSNLLSAKYDGSDVRVITSFGEVVLYDLAVYKDVVYVSDIQNGELYTVNKTTGYMESTIVTLEGETIYDITVYEKRNQPKKDRDYCAEKKCDQICISEETGASCICAEGYKFNSTGKCEESLADFHKAVVLATATHICLMDIRGLSENLYSPVCKFTVIKTPSTPQTPLQTSTTSPPLPTIPLPAPTASPDDMIKLIDVDNGGRMVYMATRNNMLYKRAIDLPIENDAKEPLRQAGGNISGLAFDNQYSANLYWTETDSSDIMFVNVETKNANKVTISNDAKLVKPRNLIILPTVRQLAWVAGNDGAVSIQTMSIDGRNLKTIISGLTDVASLVYEDETRLFFFISNGTVNQMALDGSDLRPSDNTEPTAYLLLHYKNYLSWIYSSPTFGTVIKTTDYSTNTTGTHAIIGTEPYIGIKILDAKLNLPKSTSPCAFLNGGCEQLCITKYTADIMEQQCECEVGYKLDTDKTSCRSDVVTDFFILFSEWNNPAIHQIDLRTNEINSVINRANDAYLGVYFDPNAKKIIWSEYMKSMIFSSNLDGTDKKVLGDLGKSYPYRMDKDLTTGNIYYTTFTQSNPHVGVLTPSGDNIWLKTDVTYERLWGIVVHPGKGWMYYTVVHTLSYIMRSNMDGTNAIKVVYGDHVRNPDGLTIDFNKDHLYWSDAFYDTIQRCNLDGSDCVTIVNGTGTWKDQQIRDIVTDGTYLYYAADRKDHVDQISLTSPYKRTIVGQNPGLDHIDTLAYYASTNRNIQPVSEACKARNGLGNCSTICLPTATGRTCACRPGIQLKQDGRTCSNIYQCNDIIRQEVTTAAGKEMIDIVIDRNCMRQRYEVCEYTCPEQFAPTGNKKVNNKLTCTNVGWDRESEMLCREVSCPVNSLPNVNIKEGCKHRTGEICMYQCDNGYENVTEAIICNSNMGWTPSRPCRAVTVTAIEKQSQSSGVSVAGTAAGIGVCVLVIILLVVVIVYLLRRGSSQKASSNYAATAEFHKGQDGTIAIENPGYAASESGGSVRSFRKKEEHPYSTVVHAGQGGSEPLPEVSQIESSRDTTVLTYDSWMKARQLEGGAK